jgi:DNA recombination protein RmuC
MTDMILIVVALVVPTVLLFVLFRVTSLRRNVRDDIRAELGANATELRRELSGRLSEQAQEQEQKLENIRQTLDVKLDGVRETTEKNIRALTEDNSKQLDRMRETVDEKLQKTLEERIGQSFKLVSEQLEQVHAGLGEMKTLATGVGDLKKVLSNVKTRGILGEIQLGAILEEILSAEQYEENIATKPKSSERVEFAIKLPGDSENVVYLPIDAKFPADAYSSLLDAYDVGDVSAIEAAGKVLDTAIKQAAKTIREKYVEPPATTDFAIMFLPFEGLYAEVVRRGLVEELQSKYHINIAGPTTMAALLNSLQMGFKTLAIQKRSGEVWQVLGAVKVEFEKFAKGLESAQKRLTQAGTEIDNLAGVRTRAITRKLDKLSDLPEPEHTGRHISTSRSITRSNT